MIETSDPRRHAIEMYAYAVVAFTEISHTFAVHIHIFDTDIWPLTLCVLVIEWTKPKYGRTVAWSPQVPKRAPGADKLTECFKNNA